MTEPAESTIKDTSASRRKLVYLCLVFVPLVYLYILAMLESRGRNAPAGTPQPDETLMWVLGLLVPAVCIAYVYIFLIPAIKKHRISMDFGALVLILATGDDAITMMGVIIGIMQFESTGFIPWLPVLALIIVGVAHGSYLYFFQVLPLDRQIVRK